MKKHENEKLKKNIQIRCHTQAECISGKCENGDRLQPFPGLPLHGASVIVQHSYRTTPFHCMPVVFVHHSHTALLQYGPVALNTDFIPYLNRPNTCIFKGVLPLSSVNEDNNLPISVVQQ